MAIMGMFGDSPFHRWMPPKIAHRIALTAHNTVPNVSVLFIFPLQHTSLLEPLVPALTLPDYSL